MTASEKAQPPIRVGIVGLGRAGWGMHAPALAARPDTFQVVAVCDTIGPRGAAAAQKFGCASYARIEDLVADPCVELVDIATRSCDHHRQARLALEAGKHVSIEKPMCASYEEACDLTRAARAARGRLYVHHNRRFEPAFQHIREILTDGRLGDVFEIKLRRVNYQRRDDWQTLSEFGGGQLLNWGPHIIDHALRFLGAPVREQWSALRRTTALGDAEDHVKIVLIGTNDRIVDLEISGGAALPQPEVTVWGTRGALTCDGSTIHLKYLDPARSLETRTAHPGTPGETAPGADGVTTSREAPRAMKWKPYVNPEPLQWIAESVKVAPARAVNLTSIWDALHADLRLGIPYPVTLDEALEVMRVVAAARAAAHPHPTPTHAPAT